MQKIRRILVAIKNLDAEHSPALDKAVQLAKAFRASLEIYHAIADRRSCAARSSRAPI